MSTKKIRVPSFAKGIVGGPPITSHLEFQAHRINDVDEQAILLDMLITIGAAFPQMRSPSDGIVLHTPTFLSTQQHIWEYAFDRFQGRNTRH